MVTLLIQLLIVGVILLVVWSIDERRRSELEHHEAHVQLVGLVSLLISILCPIRILGFTVNGVS
jgi:hypothetical protein